MYVWLWRRLPGPVLVRIAQCVLLFAAVCLVLFFVIFPWAEPKLPFGNVTVEPRDGAPVPTSTPRSGTTVTPSPASSSPRVPSSLVPSLPVPTVLPGE